MNCRICNKRIWPWQMSSKDVPGVHLDCKYESPEYLAEQNRIGELRVKEFFARESREREMRVEEVKEGCLRALREHEAQGGAKE